MACFPQKITRRCFQRRALLGKEREKSYSKNSQLKNPPSGFLSLGFLSSFPPPRSSPPLDLSRSFGCSGGLSFGFCQLSPGSAKPLSANAELIKRVNVIFLNAFIILLTPFLIARLLFISGKGIPDSFSSIFVRPPLARTAAILAETSH